MMFKSVSNWGETAAEMVNTWWCGTVKGFVYVIPVLVRKRVISYPDEFFCYNSGYEGRRAPRPRGPHCSGEALRAAAGRDLCLLCNWFLNVAFIQMCIAFIFKHFVPGIFCRCRAGVFISPWSPCSVCWHATPSAAHRVASCAFVLEADLSRSGARGSIVWRTKQCYCDFIPMSCHVVNVSLFYQHVITNGR